ncbi:hypothetical protein [Kineosporia sp. R_H_3]|uniref:hypothetical protein n=1 Tax=Kineosporia sp. R_H_3 TaxID=1961848 RepID=UPI000B4B262E|nr:hypothetical protein [Kineosporia sp. R_H_3]
MNSTTSTSRAVLAAAAAVLALALTGCGVAEDAVQGAQDAASDKASEAVDGAKAKASAKASELAVAAVRTQICNLVKDGSLSDADAKALEGLAAAGDEAGVPAEVVDLAKSLADAGKAATAGQVSDLEAKACQ